MSRDLETLSAFLDGETSELETRRVMRDIDNADLDVLSRWQLARDMMHNQPSMRVPTGFNAGLSAALSAEQAPPRRPAWLGSVSRLAVAASVAAATVVGWQSWDATQSSGAAPVMASAQDTRFTHPFAQTSLVSQAFIGNKPEAIPAAQTQPRVNAMLLRHSEFAARYSGQGVVPFARLVSMDARSEAR